MDTLQYILQKFNIKYDRHVALPIEIPDFNRRLLAKLFKEIGFRRGVELGVADGLYSEILCKENPECMVWSIDPWEIWGLPIHYHYRDETEVKRFYDAACARLLPLDNNVMVKKFSMDALECFEDNSIDFIYIDADHKLKSVVEDIVEWTGKVRPGGIVAGHDYIRRTPVIHVKEAVHAYTTAYGIRPWFIFGRLQGPLALKKDRERSWMWVKA